jgi:hypothetical protein
LLSKGIVLVLVLVLMLMLPHHHLLKGILLNCL